MSDDDLDERLREAAKAYHTPPDVPREAMWARIEAARRADGRRAKRAGEQPVPGVLPLRRRWMTWGAAAAAAAVLAVGIGIGRVSVDAPATPWREPATNATAYRLAAQEHLSQSEAFLTLFRTSLAQPGDQRLASATARHLLSSNRLLLDSPAALEPSVRLLLEDLELVLAEIAQLSPQSRNQDRELIREGIERGDMMPRLRTAVPSGAALTQGAL